MNMIMKYTFKYILASVAFGAAALMSGFTSSAQNLPAGTYKLENGIGSRKSATLLENGNYLIDLESFVTGNVSVHQEAVPADIVLVLDVSGSMSETIYSYSYTARSSANYNYNTNNVTNYYYKYSDTEYCKINQERTDWTRVGYQWVRYYRLSFTTRAGVTYYLTGTGITTTPPTNVTDNNTTIWNGVLYNRVRGASLGTKMANLHTAVGKFIDEIHKNDLYEDYDSENPTKRRVDADGNETTLGNQIAIVKYAGNRYYGVSQNLAWNSDNAPLTEGNHHYGNYDYNYTEVVASFTPTGTDSNVTTLKNAVNSLVASGATSSDYGMNLARLLIKNLPTSGENDRSGSTKTVVFFTDGSPTHGSDFDNDVATSTIASAYIAKSTYDAQVFTIGVFDSPTGDIHKYMNYTSSNYPNAQSMTDPRQAAPEAQRVFYQDASESDLEEIFKTVAQSSGGSGNTDVTAESSVTIDVVSATFKLPNGASADDITILVAPCTGGPTPEDGDQYCYYTFGAAKAPSEYGLPAITPHVNTTTNEVTTDGFNFSGNWVGADATSETGYHGYKQIIRFEIEVAEDAVGGPNVATNEARSGIWVNGVQATTFNRPTVKVPVQIWIKKMGLIGEDSAVFNLARAPYVAGTTPVDSDYKNFMKVMVNSSSPKDPVDGCPLVKVTGLSPDYYYRIKEDAWGWSYEYQDGGVKYTVGEGLENPFIFVNKPKDTPKEAEASIRNVFKAKEKTTTTDPEVSE